MKLYKENIANLPSFILLEDLDSSPVGYTDVTDDILSWYQVETGQIDRDFLYKLEEVRRIVKDAGGGDETIGFDTLTLEEKIVCCEFEIGSYAQRVAIIGETNAVNFSLLLTKKGMEARERRVAVSFAKFESELSVSERAELRFEAIENNLHSSYVTYGVYGSIGEGDKGGGDGVYDWFNGLGKYAGVGVIDKPYIPNTMTLQELVDFSQDVLFNGNYIYLT